MKNSYPVARIFAARRLAKKIEQDARIVVLQEAKFFVDVDTLRDLIDPRGAGACLLHLVDREREMPYEWDDNPCVVGLMDEFNNMRTVPQMGLAVRTLFRSVQFRDLLGEAIEQLQAIYPDEVGELPLILQEYLGGGLSIQ